MTDYETEKTHDEGKKAMNDTQLADNAEARLREIQ